MNSRKPNSLTLWAPAKINLTLDVLGSRTDGYHEIGSVMQKISLFDSLHFSLCPQIKISSNLNYLPCDERNLCVKAARSYFEAAGLSGGVRISVRKEIPVGAGLGGGSADAAATILALEKLYGKLDEKTRFDIAFSLGADVPFCLSDAKTCLCEGIGEKLTPLKLAGKERFHLVLVKETKKLSTGDVYTRFDKAERSKTVIGHEGMIAALAEGNLSKTGLLLSNCLEEIVLPQKPQLSLLKKEMQALKAEGVLMSGAGPTVYGLFPDERSAAAAADRLRENHPFVYEAFFL